MIKDFIATYENLRDFEKEYKTDTGRTAYDKTLANMKKRFPYYVKEIQGVADGAKVPFHQVYIGHHAIKMLLYSIQSRPETTRLDQYSSSCSIHSSRRII